MGFFKPPSEGRRGRLWRSGLGSGAPGRPTWRATHAGLPPRSRLPPRALRAEDEPQEGARPAPAPVRSSASGRSGSRAQRGARGSGAGSVGSVGRVTRPRTPRSLRAQTRAASAAPPPPPSRAAVGCRSELCPSRGYRSWVPVASLRGLLPVWGQSEHQNRTDTQTCRWRRWQQR